MKRTSVILAGLFHETHTFLEGRTGIENFSIHLGDELYGLRGDGSPLDGFLELAERKEWDVIPAVYMRAMPGPVVSDAVVDCFLREFRVRTESRLIKGVDGIFLVLHGAMVSESIRDVEGYILGHIRKLAGAGGIPVCGVVDLHANFTRSMADYTQGLVAYRENPHTDAYETAARAAGLLDSIFTAGVLPKTVYEHPPIIWPPTGTATSEEPMSALERMARKFERENEDILAVNVFAGFAFADTEDTGVSFTAVTGGSSETARGLLNGLSKQAIDRRTEGNKLNIRIESIIPVLKRKHTRPVILVEPSDNIGAGASGDGTGALRVLLEYEVHGCACVINDPQAVKELSTMQPGEKKSLHIGGKGSALDQGPVYEEVVFISRSNGHFELEDRNSHLASMIGTDIDMGPCATVRVKGVTILLTSRKTPPFDLGQLRSQGIVPEEQSVILVKAAVAHRRAYDPITEESFVVETTGPCSSDLKAFPYRYIKRPIFPLDT